MKVTLAVHNRSENWSKYTMAEWSASPTYFQKRDLVHFSRDRLPDEKNDYLSQKSSFLLGLWYFCNKVGQNSRQLSFMRHRAILFCRNVTLITVNFFRCRKSSTVANYIISTTQTAWFRNPSPIFWHDFWSIHGILLPTNPQSNVP